MLGGHECTLLEGVWVPVSHTDKNQRRLARQRLRKRGGTAIEELLVRRNLEQAGRQACA